MSRKRVVLALKVVLWLAALAPGAWLLRGYVQSDLGANPVEKITHVTGLTTLSLLLITLGVSPLRRLTGWNPLILLRRPLGLFAFFYASVHFLIWFWLYNLANPEYILEDIGERPYITVGFTAFVVLIPLAITSTKGWIRRLGKRWALIHRGIYLAAALGVVHFYWLVKADTRLPVLLGAILLALLLLRTPPGRAVLAKPRELRRAAADPLSGSSSTG